MHWETVLIVAGIFDFTHASLTEVTGVTASANGWDTRVSGIGCSPDGCIPENTLDDSIDPNSRWSCNAASADVDFCELTLEFDAPHDLVQMDMALYKGDMRTRSVNVWVDGVLQQTIESSGTTTDFETYQLVASDAMTVMLQKAGTTDNGWLSVTEIKFMEGDLSPTPSSTAPPTIILPVPTPSPTVMDDDSGLTEVTGVTASANGWDTRASGVGCAPDGCIPENTLDDSIDPNSRWSCNAALADVDFCELTLEFDAPRDLVQMYMALYKGDERTRSVNVWVNGVLQQTIESSGTTTDFETYQVAASGATSVMLQAVGTNGNGWLSVTEVKFMEGDASPTSLPATMPPSTASPSTILSAPTPSPTVVDDDYAFTPTTSTSPPTAALPPILQFAGLPDIVFDAVVEDAPYGLANGIALSDEHGIVLDPEDNGIAHLSGTVRLFDDDQTALAESITLYYYVYNDLNDPVTDFVRGEGEIDSSTGIFSAMVDVPDGKSKVVVAFVVLDEADRTTNLYPDTVVVQDVLNDCGESYFTITLEEWDNEEEYLYLTIHEPNGSGGSPGGFQGNGVILSEAFGVYGAQTYRLFYGLSLDQHDVLGDYQVTLFKEGPLTEEGVNWTVTVRVAGEVVQEVTGSFALEVSTTIYQFTYTLESYMSIANC